MTGIHFGLKAAQFTQFNLDDNTMEREVDLIMSLPLCLGTQSVNLAELNLFKSPVFPNITVMRNDYDHTYSFSGKLGGSYDDYHHPMPGLARPMTVIQSVIDRIKTITKQVILLHITLQTLV